MGDPVMPSIRASMSSENNSTNTVAISKLSGAVTGNLYVAWHFWTSDSQPSTVPSGWSTLKTVRTGGWSMVVYYKLVAAADPASWSWVWGGSTLHKWAMAEFQNVDPTNPFGDTVSDDATSGTSDTWPQLVSTRDACVAIWCTNVDSGSSYPAGPSGTTRLWNQEAFSHHFIAWQLLLPGAALTPALVETWSGTHQSMGVGIIINGTGNQTPNIRQWKSSGDTEYCFGIDDDPLDPGVSYSQGGPIKGYAITEEYNVGLGGSLVENAVRITISSRAGGSAWQKTWLDNELRDVLLCPSTVSDDMPDPPPIPDGAPTSTIVCGDVSLCDVLAEIQRSESLMLRMLSTVTMATTVDIPGQIDAVDAKIPSDLATQLSDIAAAIAALPQDGIDLAEWAGLLVSVASLLATLATVGEQTAALAADVTTVAVGTVGTVTGGLAQVMETAFEALQVIFEAINALDGGGGGGDPTNWATISGDIVSIKSAVDDMYGPWAGTVGQDGEYVEGNLGQFTRDALVAMSNYSPDHYTQTLVMAGAEEDGYLETGAKNIRVDITNIPGYAGERGGDPPLYEVNRRAEQLGWLTWEGSSGHTSPTLLVYGSQLCRCPLALASGVHVHLLPGLQADIYTVEETLVPKL